MNGILIVDKPSGPTSHDICRYFKRTLPVKKVGHAGTLDPLATGILVILLDGATKLQSLFMGGEKEYTFTIRLGISTDTYDSKGKILETKEVPLDAMERLKPLLKEFTGEIWQVPPPFSAIKKGGVPLYKLARMGKTVALEPRKVRIDSFVECPTLPPGTPHDMDLKVRCSCGTYVRSLAHDIGEKLGCGAHVTALRRLRSEPFGLDGALQISL